MTAMEQAPATGELNHHALELQRKTKRQQDELVKVLGLENAADKYIECHICHRMWFSERCWQTAAEVRRGVKALKFKNDKDAALKDNIWMQFKGMGWADTHTTLSHNGKKKKIPELQEHLIKIIGMKKGRKVPDNPPSKVPQLK